MEGDAAGHVVIDARQGADHLPLPLQGGGQVGKVLIESGQVEGGLDPVEIVPLLEVFQQAMLLEFGQDADQLGIDLLEQFGLVTAASAAEQGVDTGNQRAEIEGVVLPLALAVDDARQRLERIEERFDQHLVQGNLAEAQAVEEALHVVRQVGDVVEAEHPGQPLYGVGAAENAVQQVRIGFAAVGALPEFDQIQVELFENLLGLAEEFLDGGGGCLVAHGGLLSQKTLDQILEFLRGERFDEIGIGSKLHALVPVPLAAFGADDEQWRILVLIVGLDETDQLQSVDIRHVDVGDHQVGLAARQFTQRLETVGRLDDLVVAHRLDGGNDQRTHRR